MNTLSENPVLNYKQKEIILGTWKLIVREMKTKSYNLFVELLSAYPIYCPMFGIQKGDNLSDNNLLKAHNSAVILSFTYLIEHTLEDPFLFEAYIIGIARNHLKKPVNPVDIKNFTSLLLNYLRNFLGKQMVSAIEEAWVVFLEKINEVMRATLLTERDCLAHSRGKSINPTSK